MRTLLRCGLIAWAIAVLISVGPGAGSAQAHPTLLFTEPAAETAVATSPEAITLLFNEPVTIGTGTIVVLDQSRRELPVRSVSLARDGRFVTAAPVSALPPGTYTVRWRVTGGDGDQVEQEFRFAVGLALSPVAPTASATPAWGESAMRWGLFAGLAAAVGSLIGRRATDTARAARPDLMPVRSWAPAGIMVALIAAMAFVANRAIDARTVSAVWDGRAGVLLLIQTGGLLTALALVSGGRWALVPLAVVIAADGIRSHAGTTFGGLGAVLTGVHLAAVTIWVGALVHTTRAVVAWRAASNAVRWVLASYIRLALLTYLVVMTTGVISALLLVPLPQLVSTAYGKVLLIKLGLVGAASAVALGARRIHRDTRRATRLQTAMAIEAAVLVVVLGASAVLVSTPPPTGGRRRRRRNPPVLSCR